MHQIENFGNFESATYEKVQENFFALIFMSWYAILHHSNRLAHYELSVSVCIIIDLLPQLMIHWF